MNVAATCRSSGVMTCCGKPCPSGAMNCPRAFGVAGLYLSQTLRIDQCCRARGYFWTEGRVDYHAGHRFLDKEVKEGIIGRGDATSKIGFDGTWRCSDQSLRLVSRCWGLIGIAVTSTHFVLNCCSQADVRPPVDSGRLERPTDQCGQFRGGATELCLGDGLVICKDVNPYSRDAVGIASSARNPSSRPMPRTSRCGGQLRHFWPRLVSADTSRESSGSLQRLRRHCRTALPLPAARTEPLLPPRESSGRQTAIPVAGLCLARENLPALKKPETLFGVSQIAAAQS